MIFNLGDIPISAKYFMEWMTNRVLKIERPAYSLTTFLNDFFNEFVNNFLNVDTCYANRNKQKTRLNQAALTSYNEYSGEGHPDNITHWCENFGTTRLDIKKALHRLGL